MPYLGKAPANVLFDASDIADNLIGIEHLEDDTVGIAELSATGTASATTFLRGDNAWADPLSDSVKGFAIAMSVAL